MKHKSQQQVTKMGQLPVSVKQLPILLLLLLISNPGPKLVLGFESQPATSTPITSSSSSITIEQSHNYINPTPLEGLNSSGDDQQQVIQIKRQNEFTSKHQRRSIGKQPQLHQHQHQQQPVGGKQMPQATINTAPSDFKNYVKLSGNNQHPQPNGSLPRHLAHLISPATSGLHSNSVLQRYYNSNNDTTATIYSKQASRLAPSELTVLPHQQIDYRNDRFYKQHHYQKQLVEHAPNLSNQTASSKRRKVGFLDKICMGTEKNRMSSQHNKSDHYQNLAERYKGCTYIMGNLEITWLDEKASDQPLDLSFLESIREITGYLLIANVNVEKIRMPNLQIIRGRDLFKFNNDEKEEFALILIENELKTLELPNLREILAGHFGSYNNRNLCHIRTINWDEIMTPMFGAKFVYNGTQPECPPCDVSCQGACWAEGPEMCQKFSKVTCPQCNEGRCFGPLASECCHSFCAGGCDGPTASDCFSCKNFYDDGTCIQECPSIQRYNPSEFLSEPNPNGKYAFGATCVKECPEHMLRDNGACVKTCPPNKRSSGGECVPCGGPCPKRCQGVEVVHSGNIDQLINCTVIEGSISIWDSSFTGHPEPAQGSQGNISTGASLSGTNSIRSKPMHPSRLEVLETVQEITHQLHIQASHVDFKNLSCFKNLKLIGGRQTLEMDYALTIVKTSLVSLNLRSLRKVRSGRILIEENRELCFADTIDWLQINITRREDIVTRNNGDSFKCRQQGLVCHEQCAQDGCWGPGPDECLSCNNYKLDDYCVNNCTGSASTSGQLSYDSGGRTCKRCHQECRGGCSGVEARHCWQCKSVKDGPHCVAKCPKHKYIASGTCEECDKSCLDGCTGPGNHLGDGGCNSCAKGLVNSTDPQFVGHCIRSEEACPEGYYQEYISPHIEGPLSLLAGRMACRKCHHRCKSCTGMGTHVSVCECAKFLAGEQCEDECPRDYFADDQQRHCFKCSPECNGCFGPTEADCLTCRVYRIYHEPVPVSIDTISLGASSAAAIISQHQQLPVGARGPPSARFNCTAQCPANKPYRRSNLLDPYCSEDSVDDIESARGLISLGPLSSLMLLLIVCAAVVSCVSVYRCQLEKNKTVKLTMHLSGIDDVEPLKPSHLKPNLAPLRSIKETELRKGNVLGSGFGGTVYQGFWYPEGQEHKQSRPVAIKVLRDNGQSNMNKEFLDEAYIMASVNHPNLVRLLAVCMTPNHLMLVTQLMPLGCLLDYVKRHKSDIGSKNLLEWCKQIARGMAYLEENRMVHRDLALRNVLLQTSGRALISDFGLAKLLELDQSEYHSGGGRLPIKWLAPECIRERKFTHKSDVWAFGVTVWELLTFGARPFDEYDTKDVPLAIEKGARLQQPVYMSAEVYKVMYACWFYSPEDRPNFRSLAQSFVNFARDPERYLALSPKGFECVPQKLNLLSRRRRRQRQLKLAAAANVGSYENDDSLGDIEDPIADHEDENDNDCDEDDDDVLYDDTDDIMNGTGSELDASEVDEPPLGSAMPDLTPSTHNRLNETLFGFDLHHHHHLHHHQLIQQQQQHQQQQQQQQQQHQIHKAHSNNNSPPNSAATTTTTIAQHLITPTLKKVFHLGGSSSSSSGGVGATPSDPMDAFATSGQHMSLKRNCLSVKAAPTSSSPLMTDANNNNFVPARNSCWSMHHSTNSLGHKSEQPTDMYDYLLPSPFTEEHDMHFNGFYTDLVHLEPKSMPVTPISSAHQQPQQQQQQQSGVTRNPPNSAGLIGLNNEEYFLSSLNYVNQNVCQQQLDIKIQHHKQRKRKLRLGKTKRRSRHSQERQALEESASTSGLSISISNSDADQDQSSVPLGDRLEGGHHSLSASNGNIPHSLV